MYNTNKILKGEAFLRGDKSISHRLLMMASLIEDDSVLYNLSDASDVITTIDCLKACGVNIQSKSKISSSAPIKIKGGNLQNPTNTLNCQNSGSTARMLIGLLAGQGINASFSGDDSLLKRPMLRIIEPLIDMGVDIQSNNNFLPLNINLKNIKPINYCIKTNSAQVKSALMFAALGSKEYSYIAYNEYTRNHSEKLLQYLNCNLEIGGKIKLKKTIFRKGIKVHVPGDISSAAFLIAASIIIPGSKIKLRNILYNSTRMGFIEILKKMGAKIKISEINNDSFESTCTIESEFSPNLVPVKINKDNIIQLIDEIPILCAVATQVSGRTIIEDAGELRLKESDRLHAICENLKSMGADVSEREEGLSIVGKKKLYNTTINSFGDHRIAMSFEILNFLVSGTYCGSFSNIIKVSFPDFYNTIDCLSK